MCSSDLDVYDKLVPIMALVYLIGAVIIILMHVSAVPAAIGMIFKDAWTGKAALGGFAGATMSQALRWGMARGLYSNEAGFGTSPQGHAAANVDHPVRQGFWGVFEVFVDTIIVWSYGLSHYPNRNASWHAFGRRRSLCRNQHQET